MATRDSFSQLKKELGASQFFTLGFGTIIGVGWVIVLGEWLRQAGPMGAIFAFLGGGVVMMLVGLCYAEMAAMLPVSGGEVAYAYEAFGVKSCFAVGWFLALAWVATTVFEGISVGWVVGALLPGIQGPTLYSNRGDPVQLGGLLLGVGGMVLLAWLNYRGAKAAARFQDVLTYALLGVSVVFFAAGLIGGRWTNLQPLFENASSSSIWHGILAVFVATPFWYGGFNVIPQVMEEKAPGTSVRLAARMILVAILAAGLFYGLVILSASMVTPWKDLLALELPAAGAFEAAFHSPAMGKLVLVAALLGLVTTWNAVFLAGSRVLFALGRARIIPAALGRVHPVYGSPSTAVVFVGVLGSLGVLAGRSAILPLVNVGASALALAFIVTCVGVVKLRRREAERARSDRLRGGTTIGVLGALCSLFIFIVSLYQPYANANGVFPLEWALFLGWAALGALFWVAAYGIRSGVAEADRRKLILGTSTVAE